VAAALEFNDHRQYRLSTPTILHVRDG
jgi:hypothetical protein